MKKKFKYKTSQRGIKQIGNFQFPTFTKMQGDTSVVQYFSPQ